MGIVALTDAISPSISGGVSSTALLEMTKSRVIADVHGHFDIAYGGMHRTSIVSKISLVLLEFGNKLKCTCVPLGL